VGPKEHISSFSLGESNNVKVRRYFPCTSYMRSGNIDFDLRSNGFCPVEIQDLTLAMSVLPCVCVCVGPLASLFVLFTKMNEVREM